MMKMYFRWSLACRPNVWSQPVGTWMRVTFAFSAIAFWAVAIQPPCLCAQTEPDQKSKVQETKPNLPPVKTSITVTETISAEAPASITVVDKSRIEEAPGINLDDRLRTVPG